MGKILGFLLAWITKKGLLSTLYYSLAGIYFFSVIAMITSFFIALDYFIDLIRDVLTISGNYSGSLIISKFFGLLNCIGFVDALSDSAPVLAFSLIFLIGRILIIQVNKVFKTAFGMISDIMKIGI